MSTDSDKDDSVCKESASASSLSSVQWEDESILHALVTCPFAHQCWQKRGPVVQITGDESFAGWLQKMIDCNNKNEYGEIATLCWSIWQARNNLVWNRNRSEVQNVVYSTKRYLAEWK